LFTTKTIVIKQQTNNKKYIFYMAFVNDGLMVEVGGSIPGRLRSKSVKWASVAFLVNVDH